MIHLRYSNYIADDKEDLFYITREFFTQGIYDRVHSDNTSTLNEIRNKNLRIMRNFINAILILINSNDIDLQHNINGDKYEYYKHEKVI